MRIVVLTDTHANLPALEAVLSKIKRNGYDALFHLGDAVGIGPFPSECLNLLLEQANTFCLMGNHDKGFARGVPQVRPDGMRVGEYEHLQWTHEQLDSSLKPVVASWAYKVIQTLGDTTLSFVHYALDKTQQSWLPIIEEPRGEDLDNLFGPEASDIIFYGHHHPFSDLTGKGRYINPGSLGCNQTALARYATIEYERAQLTIEYHSQPYDDASLSSAFKVRDVPDKALICKAFFGNRLTF